MTDNVGRVFLGLSALALLWIIVYWWWEPSRPAVTFDTGTGVMKHTGGEAPARSPGTSGDRGPGPSDRSASNPDPVKVAIIPPRFDSYVIQKDDTIDSIAKRKLGSAKYAAAILSANPQMSPEHLKAGRTIRIPLDPTNIQGKPVSPETRVVVAPPQAPTVKEPTTAPVAPTGTPNPAGEPATEYIVKAGESLSAISKKFYGTTSLSAVIFEANRDQLTDEDSVRAGQTLKIPPKPKR